MALVEDFLFYHSGLLFDSIYRWLEDLWKCRKNSFKLLLGERTETHVENCTKLDAELNESSFSCS
jgi:hypothetical protein